MGSDLYMNPTPPPPIHEQVKALVDTNVSLARVNNSLKGEIHDLIVQKDKDEVRLVRFVREVEDREQYLKELQRFIQDVADTIGQVRHIPSLPTNDGEEWEWEPADDEKLEDLQRQAKELLLPSVRDE